MPRETPGERRRAEFLPFSKPSIGEEEIAEVLDCLRSGWITTGPRTERFEREFAAYTGAKHALALTSGTAALHCAFLALGIGPGDEVICPSLTWPATSNMVLAVGARPVFAEIDRRTLQIDPESVAASIGPRTRAVVPVHFAGAPADLDALRELCGDHIALVEDAAHAAGTEYRGRRVGSGANIAGFSFHPIKNLTTGEGGMLTTGDDEIARKVKLFKFHGVSRDAWKAYGASATARYDTLAAGFKYNLTDLASALGIHQLRKLDGFNARRAELAARYRAGLEGAPGVEVPTPPAYPHRHAWHLFTVLVPRRDEFMARLKAANIGTGLHFEAVHRTSLYRAGAPSLPATEEVCERIVSLPLFPSMTQEDLDDVVDAVRRIAGDLLRL